MKSHVTISTSIKAPLLIREVPNFLMDVLMITTLLSVEIVCGEIDHKSFLTKKPHTVRKR